MMNAMRDAKVKLIKSFTIYIFRNISNQHYFMRNMGKFVAQDLVICLSHVDIAWCFVTRRNEINDYYTKYVHYR